MRLSAGDLLKRHVIERRFRYSIRGVDMERDLRTAVPRMSHGQWVDSCQLTAGIPSEVLALISVWVWGTDGTTWTVDAVRVGEELMNVPLEQVAIPITLAEAARRLGMGLSYAQARALYRSAIDAVNEKLVRRASRDGVAA